MGTPGGKGATRPAAGEGEEEEAGNAKDEELLLLEADDAGEVRRSASTGEVAAS
jgi:hypothetical protein